ncbi:hypothetical protein [Andreprevotia chitinilytica]|uniref:hypothetical protein n=1 Tax=Andreprevotia chitinilytica TaxID=396808 RepID=UPI000550519B|nr:hypothetical protein [Andreprevotia chitinilytica]
MQGVVYRKTQQGLEEMINRSSGISVKLRQLLIQIDGIKPVASLVTPLEGRELVQGLMALEWDALIEKVPGSVATFAPAPSNTPAAAPAPVASPALPAGVQAVSSGQLARIQHILYVTNRTHLTGELDEWLETVVPRVKDTQALGDCLDHWERRMNAKGQSGMARTYKAQIIAILQG